MGIGLVETKFCSFMLSYSDSSHWTWWETSNPNKCVNNGWWIDWPVVHALKIGQYELLYTSSCGGNTTLAFPCLKYYQRYRHDLGGKTWTNVRSRRRLLWWPLALCAIIFGYMNRFDSYLDFEIAEVLALNNHDEIIGWLQYCLIHAFTRNAMYPDIIHTNTDPVVHIRHTNP